MESDNKVVVLNERERMREISESTEGVSQRLHDLGFRLADTLRECTNCKALSSRKVFYNLITISVFIILFRIYR